MEKFRFDLSITPDKILVTDLKTGEIFHYTNQAIVQQSSGRLISLGKTKEEFLQEYSRYDCQQIENEFLMVSPFGAEGIQRGTSLATLDYITGVAVNSSREQNHIWPLLPTLRFGVRLNISGYDQIPIQIKLMFETKLMQEFRTIEINGRDLGIYKRKMKFADAVLGVIQVIIAMPLISLFFYFSLNSDLPLIQSLPVSVLILLTILYGLIAFGLIIFVGGLLTAIFMRKFLSPDLFSVFLEMRKGHWPNWFTRFLSRHFVKTVS